MSAKDFHHYKGEDMTPAEKVERVYAQMLLDSRIADQDHASSVIFELKHSSGCCQIARILAQKRGLDIEIAETAALLHDIYVGVTGRNDSHAVKGAPLAEKLLRQVGGFSNEKIHQITDAIRHHSEKEVHSNDPYLELVKDVDVFDCSLYRGAENYYRLHKSPEIVDAYIARIRAVRAELGLNEDEVFRP